MMDKVFEKMGIPTLPEKQKNKIFLGFYFVFFFSVLLLMIFWGGKCKCEPCIINQNSPNNYEFELNIFDHNSVDVLLSGKIHDNAILLNKKVKDDVIRYYIYYGELYVWEEEEWILSSEKVLDDFDLKYLFNDYLEYIIGKSTYDKTENLKKIYINSELNLNIEYTNDEEGNTKHYNVMGENYSLNIKYYNFNEITEFEESIY